MQHHETAQRSHSHRAGHWYLKKGTGHRFEESAPAIRPQSPPNLLQKYLSKGSFWKPSGSRTHLTFTGNVKCQPEQRNKRECLYLKQADIAATRHL